MAGPAVSLVRPAPMDHPVHARLTDVTRIYPARAGQAAVHALGPLSMELRAGEFFSVVGPSGCGKSTLLDVLAGLALPSAGTVTVGGRRYRVGRISDIQTQVGPIWNLRSGGR